MTVFSYLDVRRMLRLLRIDVICILNFQSCFKSTTRLFCDAEVGRLILMKELKTLFDACLLINITYKLNFNNFIYHYYRGKNIC
jgi:hypothetical protein